MFECEVPKAFSDKIRRARKPHKCCECGCTIQPGEAYGRSSGVWDFGAASYAQHLDCRNACILVRDYFNDGECLAFGGLMDWYGETRHWIRPGSGDPERTRELRTLLAGIRSRQRSARA